MCDSKRSFAPSGILVAALLVFHTGCIAMNIPSRRDFDGTDDGGILGGWSKPKRFGVPHADASGPPAARDDATFRHHFGDVVDNPLDVEPGTLPHAGTNLADSCLGHSVYLDGPTDIHADGLQGQRSPAAEVPWPRFHPVPTRPVYAATGIGFGPAGTSPSQ